MIDKALYKCEDCDDQFLAHEIRRNCPNCDFDNVIYLREKHTEKTNCPNHWQCQNCGSVHEVEITPISEDREFCNQCEYPETKREN